MPSEEEQRLRQATREAHEAMQGLASLLRQARELAPVLVSEFEQVHHREIMQLSNHLTAESNRHASQLNAEVERARDFIWRQLMAGEAKFDRHAGTVTIRWGAGKFEDNQPAPYPQVTTREDNQ